MPREVDECVDALLRQNPDMPEPEAWAICYDRYNRNKECFCSDNRIDNRNK